MDIPHIAAPGERRGSQVARPHPSPLCLAPAEFWPAIRWKQTPEKDRDRRRLPLRALSPHPAGASRGGLSPDPRTPPSRLDAPWREAVDSPMRLVIASGQSLKWEPGMARALGTGEDRSPSGASGAKPSFPVWRTPKQWPGDGPGVRPPQLPFVFFLLGSFPKQTNQGGKTERTWRREMPASGLPGKGSAGAPFPAGVPEGAKPQTGRGPQTGLLGMEKHFKQPQETCQ